MHSTRWATPGLLGGLHYVHEDLFCWRFAVGYSKRSTRLCWKSCGYMHGVVGLGHSMTLVLVGSCEGET
jgi:hypothetical protein